MADRYWVGGSAAWDTPAGTKWSATSGGTGGASAPTSADNVFFDQASTYTVTIGPSAACADLTVSAGTVTFATGAAGSLSVSGSFSVIAGTVWSSTNRVTFAATTSGKTITTNGVAFAGPWTFDGIGGVWALQDNLTQNNELRFTNGTLDFNNKTLSGSYTNFIFAGSNSGTFTINNTGGTTVTTSAPVTQQNFLTVNLNTNLITTATTGYTYSNGTLNLNSYVLTTQRFISGGNAIRNLNFGTGKIVLNGSSTATIWNTNQPGSLVVTGTSLVECTGGGSGVTKTISTGPLSESQAISFSFLETTGSVTYAFEAGVSGGHVFRNLIVNGQQTINNAQITIFGNFTHQNTNGTTTFAAGTTAWTFAATSGSQTITGTMPTGMVTTGSGRFNGTTDYLSNTGSTAFTFGTGDFTVEYWVYITSEAATYNQHVGCSATNNGFSFGTTGGGKMYMTTLNAGYASTGASFATNRWNHFAFVRSAGTVTFYLNGTVNFTTAAATDITETGFGIGATAAGTFPMAGYISNLRVVKGVAVYNGAFTPPSLSPLATSGAGSAACYSSTTNVDTTFAGSSTSLLTCQSSTVFVDNSASAVSITRNSTAVPTTFAPGDTIYDFPWTFGSAASTASWTLGTNLTLGATRTATFTLGTLALGSYTFTTGLFSSSNSNTRTLDFGTGKISLYAATASTIWTTATVTGLTVSGTPVVETWGGGSAVTKTINTGALSEANSISFNLINISGTVTYAFTASNTVKNLFVNGTQTISNIAITIFGNFTHQNTAGTTTFTAGTNVWTFGATSGTKTITPLSAFTYDFPWNINGIGGTFQLQTNNLVIGSTRSFTLTNGTFDFNSRSLTGPTTGITIATGSSTIANTGTVGFTTTLPITHTSGTLNLGANLTTTNASGYAHNGGTLNLNTFILTTPIFASGGTGTRAIAFDTGKIVLNGSVTTTIWNSNHTGLTISGTPLVECIGGGTGVTKTINAGSSTTEANSINFSFLETTGTVTYAFTASVGAVRNLIFNGVQTISNAGLTIFGSFTHQTTNGATTFSAGTNAWTFAATSGSYNINNIAGFTYDFPWTFGSTATAQSTATWTLVNNLTLGATRQLTLANGTTDFNNKTLSAQGITVNGSTRAATIANTGGSGFTTSLTVTHTTGTLNLTLDLTTTNATGYTLTAGTLALNTFTLTTRRFTSSNTNTRTLNFGTGKIVLNGSVTDTIWATNQIAGFTILGSRLIECTGGGTSVTKSINPGSETSTSWSPFGESMALNFSFLETSGSVTYSFIGPPAAPASELTAVGSLTFNGTQTIAHPTFSRLFIYGDFIHQTTNGTTTFNGGSTCIWHFAATSGSRTITSVPGVTYNFPWIIGNATSTATWTLTNNLTLSGALVLSNGNFDFNSRTVSVTGITIAGGTVTIANTGGSGFSTTLPITHNSGTLTLTLNLTTTNVNGYTLTAGTLALSTFTLTTTVLVSNNSNTRGIAFGTGQLALTGNNTTVFNLTTSTNFTTTGTVYINSTYTGSTGTRTFVTGFTEAQAAGYNVRTTGTSGVVFGTTATDSVTFTGNWNDFDLTGLTNTLNNTTRTLYGNYTLPASGGTLTSGAAITTFAGAGTELITTNGRSAPSIITINSTGTTRLADAYSSFWACFLTSGTLDLNNFTMSVGAFSSSGATARTIAFGSSGQLALTSNNITILDINNATNFAYTGTPYFNLTYSGSSGTRYIKLGSSDVAGGAQGAFTSAATTFDVAATGNLGIVLGPGTDTINFSGGYVNNIDLTGMVGNIQFFNGFLGSGVNLYGNFVLPSVGGTITSSDLKFISNGVQTINTNNRLFDADIVVGASGTTGTLRFLSDHTSFSVGASIVLTSGTLDLNNFVIETFAFSSSNTNNRSIAFGSSGRLIISNNGNSTAWFTSTATNLIWTGTFNVSAYNSGAGTVRTFTFGDIAEAYTFDIKFAATAQANAFTFLTASTDSLTITGNLRDLDFTGSTNTLVNAARNLHGNLILPATGGTISPGSSTTTFIGTGTEFITTNGRTIPFPITFNGLGTYRIVDSMSLSTTTGNVITLTQGTLDLNNNTVSCVAFNSNNTNLRSIQFGSTGQITLTGANATILDFTNATNFTESGTVRINSNYTGGTGTRTVNFGGTAGANPDNVFNVTIGGTGLSFAAATDTIALIGYFGDVDLTGLTSTHTLSNTLRTIYGNLTVPATGGAITGGATTTTLSAPLTTPAANAYSAYFDGNGDYLSLTGQNLSTTNWTIECWVLFNNFTNIQPHIFNFGTDSNNRYALFRETGGAFRFTRRNAGIDNNATGTTTVLANTWYHVAVERNSSTGVATLYVNGIAEATSTTASLSSGTNWAIGWQQIGGFTGDYLNGCISNFRVTNSLVISGNSGQASFVTPGTYSWTAPTGVTSVSVVCIGGGGAGSNSIHGGGGGGLGWKNNIAVTPGNSYTVVVGAAGVPGTSTGSVNGGNGGDSYFINLATVSGGGGRGGAAGGVNTGGTFTGDGGGVGGVGGTYSGSGSAQGAGGGGAGGYSDSGGAGALASGQSTDPGPAMAGQGGGGGGGGASFNDTNGNGNFVSGGAGGGGVGIFGQGSNGAAGVSNAGSAGTGGGGGSNGTAGAIGTGIQFTGARQGGTGGLYGGGGGGSGGVGTSGSPSVTGGQAGAGAVRIIWGVNQTFPSPLGYVVSTVPLTATGNTVLLTCQNNTFRDNSTNNFAVTPNGNITPSYIGPFAGQTPTTKTVTTNGRTLDFPLTIGGDFVSGSGITQLAGASTIGSTRTLTLNAGTLDLNNFVFTVGLLSSNNTNTRSINFASTGQITLSPTTGGTLIDFTTATNFTYSGTPRIYSIAGVSGTRTFIFGSTAGATATNTFDVTIGTSGTGIVINAVADTLALNGHYNNVTFTGLSNTVSNTGINFWGNLTIPSASGTFSAGTNPMTFVGSGFKNLDINNRILDFPLTINAPAGTLRLTSACRTTATRALTLTAGNLNLNNNNFIGGTLSSSNTNLRRIDFDNNGMLRLAASSTTVVDLAIMDNFSYTGTPFIDATVTGGTRIFNFGSTSGAMPDKVINVNIGGSSGLAIAAGADIITLNGSYGDVNLTGLTNTLSNSVRTIYGNLTIPSTGGSIAAGTNTTTLSAPLTVPASTAYSAYFDGSGDYLSVPNATQLQLAGGPFTVEFWAYVTNSGNYRTFISKRALAGANPEWELSLNNVNNNILFYNGTIYNSGLTAILNTWNHIAISFNGADGTVYLNGVASTPISFTVTNNTNPVYIGNVNNQFLAGYISNLRVIKGVAIYTGNFTPPSLAPLATSGSASAAAYPSTINVNTLFPSSATSLLTCQNNTFIDNSTNAFTITPIGNTTASYLSPFAGSTPTTKIITTNDRVVDFPITIGDVIAGLGIIQLAGNITTSSSRTLTLTSGTLDTNNFVFLAGSLSSSNGNSRAIDFKSSGRISLETFNATIVDFTTATNFTYSGNARIVSTNATSGTRTFVFGPTGATATNTLNVNMLAQAGTVANGNSVQFTSASLTIGSTSQFAIATTTTPFCVECWVRPTAAGGVIFSEQFTGAGNPVAMTITMSNGTNVDVTTGQTVAFGFYSGTAWTTAAAANTALTLNQWTHIACVFTGSTSRIYYNGADVTKSATPTPATTWARTGDAGNSWYIGRRWDASSTVFFTGLISNFRFVVGSAVYTTAFTPLTGPLTAITNTRLLTCQTLTFTDASTNNFTITNSNAVAVTTSPFNPLYVDVNTSEGLIIAAGSDTLTLQGSFNNFNLTGLTNTLNNTQRSVFGNLTFPATGGTITAGTADTIMVATAGVDLITYNGRTIDFPLTINGTGGTFRSNGSILLGATRALTLTNGLFDANLQSISGSGITVLTGNASVTNLDTGLAVTHTSGNLNLFANVLRTGTYTISSGNVNFYANANVAVFTHTAGNVNMFSSGRTNNYTFTAGNINLLNNNLIVPTFTSSGSTARTINFGNGNIILTANTATTIWNTGTVTNFAATGTGSVRTIGGGATTKTINTGTMTEAQSLNFSLENTAGTVAFTAANAVHDLTVNGAFTLTNIAITIYGNYTYTTATALTAGTNAWTFAATSGIQTITSGAAGMSTTGSGLFNGSSSYLSAPNNTALDLSSGNFTIEAWVYWTGANSFSVIMDKDGVSGSAYPSYGLTLNGSNAIRFLVGSGNGTTYQQILTSSTAMPTNQWVHIAGVKNGTTLTLYQNGVSVATATQTGTIVDGGKNLLMGYATGQPATNYMSGYISNLRVVKGTAVYTGAFTPPSRAPLATSGAASAAAYSSTTNVDTSFAASATSLLTCQSPTAFVDASTNAFTITNIGSVQATTFVPDPIYDFPWTFNGVGGTFVLQSAATIGATRTTTLTNGTLDLNGYTYSTGTVSTAAGTKSIIFDGGTIVITGSGATAWNNANPTGFTANRGTANGTISMTSASAKTFVGGGSNYAGGILNQGGTGTLTVTGSNTFEDISATISTSAASTISFTAGTTTTFNNFTITGTASFQPTLNSTAAGTTVTFYSPLAVPGFVTGANYIQVRDIGFTPYATNGTDFIHWHIGLNSQIIDNCFGALAQAYLAGATPKVYLINTGATWAIPRDFNTTNNIIHLIGGGGGGFQSPSLGGSGGGGGGGGGYTRVTNFNVTNNLTIVYSIGAGGAASTSGNPTTFGPHSAAGGAGSTGRIGGAGGNGSTATGGAGGDGHPFASGDIMGSAGGGGAAGPLGNGARGGNGVSSAGGGGGGNSGGSAGIGGGAGGNNANGVGGGGINGIAGTRGGGGGANTNATSPVPAGRGGSGVDILNSIGSGGGGGGTVRFTGSTTGGAGGLYGGGGGGKASDGTAGQGGQGVIIIQYLPVTPKFLGWFN